MNLDDALVSEYSSLETQENVMVGLFSALLDATQQGASISPVNFNANEVHVVGCCTDICVLHTVIDAYTHGYRIVVHEEGVASFNQTGHAWTLEHFKNCLNAKVVKDSI